MRRRKIDSQIERQLITAMIMSKEFLGQAVPVIDLDLIESDHFRLIGRWCLDYFETYKKAPQDHIETIYHAWSEKQEEPTATTEAIHAFLEDLSDQYEAAEDLNVPYLLDTLGSFLTIRKLSRVRDGLDYSLHQGDEKEAERSILDYRGITIGAGAGIDPLNDEKAWERAFAEPVKPLFTFPGDAGRFLNAALVRDSLIGIQGPEKRGKTWWCVEFVMRALRERRKVALFEVGDLSESQIMLRLGVRLSGRPGRKDLCGSIGIPLSIERPESGSGGEAHAKVLMKSKDYQHPVTKNACLKACKRFLRSCGIPRGKPYIKISIHANSSINVRGIEGILQGWEMQEKFIPDVIVIDYADILSAEDPNKQARDQVNDTWKALRRLSQERHCLVIVPTQADAGSYDINTQSMKNFSEDKRKLAHVTGMIGLNQNDQEKQLNIMRLNWLVLRESPYSSSYCLHVAQCISLGKAFCCATL